MIAYKFLKAGRIAPFSGYHWPAPDGNWHDAEGELSVCSWGIHACRVSDLPYWIDQELWRIELDGPVVEHSLKLVAPRGRLLERVVAWQDSNRQAFALHCLRRAARHAAAELRDAGLDGEAASLEQAASTADLHGVRTTAGRAASLAAEGGSLARHAGHLATYVLDAVEWLEDPAGVAYVAAHAADSRSAPDDGDPFVRERTLQANWLCEELQLISS